MRDNVERAFRDIQRNQQNVQAQREFPVDEQNGVDIIDIVDDLRDEPRQPNPVNAPN